MKRIELAKQNFFKQYDQLSMPTYGECFEAGYKAALIDLIKYENVPDYYITQDLYYEVHYSHIVNFADEEVDDVPPCGTDVTK